MEVNLPHSDQAVQTHLCFCRVFFFAQRGNRDLERVLCVGQSMQLEGELQEGELQEGLYADMFAVAEGSGELLFAHPEKTGRWWQERANLWTKKRKEQHVDFSIIARINE